jgi:hypothetical protein
VKKNKKGKRYWFDWYVRSRGGQQGKQKKGSELILFFLCVLERKRQSNMQIIFHQCCNSACGLDIKRDTVSSSKEVAD